MKEKRPVAFFMHLSPLFFWGVWGAFIEIPEKAGFPATLGYVVWSLTMIPPSVYALYRIGWKLDYDRRSVLLGSVVGAAWGRRTAIPVPGSATGTSLYCISDNITLPGTHNFPVSCISEGADSPQAMDRNNSCSYCNVFSFQSPDQPGEFSRYRMAAAGSSCIFNVGISGICDEVLKYFNEGRKHLLLYDK